MGKEVHLPKPELKVGHTIKVKDIKPTEEQLWDLVAAFPGRAAKR